MCPPARAAPAQRARRPAGGDDPFGTQREVPGLQRGEEDPYGIGAVLGVVENDRLVELGLGDGQQLHDDGSGVRVPAQAHGPDPEFGVDGRDERARVIEFGALRRYFRTEPAVYFLEQESHPIREYLNLLLLQQHADDTCLVNRLEIERPVAGLTHRSRNEPVRSAEYVNCA